MMVYRRDSTSATNEHGGTQGTCATGDIGDFAGTDGTWV